MTDEFWSEEFDKRFTVWFSELVAGKGNAKRGWWDIVNNATVEEVKAFISKVATQARQQAFTEALEAVGNEEDEDKLKIPVGSSPFYSAERIRYEAIALQNRNVTRKKIRANIEKRMKQ